MTELRILGQAVRTIVSAIVTARELETGGILVGPDRQNGGLLVTHATEAGPSAERRPASFRRDTAWCQEQVNAWHREMLVDWIGDWHLHPAGHTWPSVTDIESARRMVRDSALDFQRFLLVIAQPPSMNKVILRAFMITADDVDDWGRCTVSVGSVDDLNMARFENLDSQLPEMHEGNDVTQASSEDAPPSSAEAQAAYAQQMLAEAREELMRADSKAAMLLSAALVAGSFLGGAAFSGEWSPLAIPGCWQWMLWAGLVAWFVAVVDLLAAAFPRIGRPTDRTHLTYFRHAEMHMSPDELRDSLASVAHDPLHRLVDQLWNVSKVAVMKYRRVQRGLIALAVGGVLLGAVVVIESVGPSSCSLG